MLPYLLSLGWQYLSSTQYMCIIKILVVIFLEFILCHNEIGNDVWRKTHKLVSQGTPQILLLNFVENDNHLKYFILPLIILLKWCMSILMKIKRFTFDALKPKNGCIPKYTVLTLLLTKNPMDISYMHTFLFMNILHRYCTHIISIFSSFCRIFGTFHLQG